MWLSSSGLDTIRAVGSLTANKLGVFSYAHPDVSSGVLAHDISWPELEESKKRKLLSIANSCPYYWLKVHFRFRHVSVNKKTKIIGL